MRLYELFDEEAHKEDKRSDEDPSDSRLSPLTIPPKHFIHARAIGQNGALRKDGSVKKKYQDQIKKKAPVDDPRSGQAHGKEANAAKINRATTDANQEKYSGSQPVSSVKL